MATEVVIKTCEKKGKRRMCKNMCYIKDSKDVQSVIIGCNVYWENVIVYSKMSAL